jgi:hypothetical protein
MSFFAISTISETSESESSFYLLVFTSLLLHLEQSLERSAAAY